FAAPYSSLYIWPGWFFVIVRSWSLSSQQGWRTSTRCGPGVSLREKRVLSPRSRSSTVTCACWRTCSFTSSTSAGLAGGGAVRCRLFSDVGRTALTVGGAAGGTVLDL